MPEWTHIIGKTVLIGLTFTDAAGDVRDQVQRHGVIEVADEERGFGVRLVAPGQPWDRELYWLPPDPEALQEAAPGTYRLRSTGETVVDPDFTSTWTVESPGEEDDTPEQRAARLEEARRFGFPP